MPITVRLALEAPYSYVEATFDAVAEINDAELWDLVTRLNDGAPRDEDESRSQTFEDGTPLPPEDSAPQNDADLAPNERRHHEAPRQQPRAGAKRGSGLFCPDHQRIELIQSADQYQEWDDGPNGEKVPAKFFCPGKENGTGRNHSIWRSRALVPEAV